MQSKLPQTLIALALCAAVSSCGNRVETRLAFPPVADLQIVEEPGYPVEAVQPGEAGKAAEDAWWNDVLLWGRDHRDKLARVCKWSADLGYEVPAGWCSG